MKKKTTALKKKSPVSAKPTGLKNNSTFNEDYQKNPEFSIKPDWKMVNQFLDALTSSRNESVTFQTFHDRDRNDRLLATYRHLKRGANYQCLLLKRNYSAPCSSINFGHVP